MEDTINVLGLDKALELLAETAEIQETGGMTTQDGKYVYVVILCVLCVISKYVCTVTTVTAFLFMG